MRRNKNRISKLYPDMEKRGEEHTLALDVWESYQENRRLHNKVDEVKERSIKFLHGEHFDEDVEAQREAAGLPSLVADKTLSVYKTLDGYARKNKVDISFMPVGGDDFRASKIHNKIHHHIKKQKELHHYQAKAYGQSSITDEAYFYLYPEMNSMGQMDPEFHVFDSFEAYPDANFKDPIKMRDAAFFDIVTTINPNNIEREFRGHMDPEFKRQLEKYNPNEPYDDLRARNQYKNRDSESLTDSNGLPIVIKRFYKRYELKKFLINYEEEIVEEMTEEDRDIITDDMAKALGWEILEVDTEQLWTAVLIPAVTTDYFVMDEFADFQPIDPERLGKVFWPVTRFIFNDVAGKAVGAIRGIIKIQEARNLILSALLHHIQTAANGGMLMEKGAFGGDEDEANKFKTKRNRANYTGVVANDALKEKRIGVVPKGEFAFRDGGDYLESVLMDVIRDYSGAEPVMKGQAQKGAPASLYAQQIEQSAVQLMGSAEYFRQAQNHNATLIYAFTRQFWTERRILMLEGRMGQEPQQMVLNEQGGEGVLNDPSHGLFTVYKTFGPVTESEKRRALADALDVARALADIGIPSFAQDLTNIVENIDKISDENRASMYAKIQQWQQLQGIGEEVRVQGEQAGAEKQTLENLFAGQPRGRAPV